MPTALMVALSVAFAQPLLISDQDRATASAQFSERQYLSWETLLQGAPRASGGQLTLCDGPGISDINALISELEGHLFYMEFEQGIQRAERTLDGMPCWQEPVEPAELGRLLFLAGLLAALADDRDLASQRFQWAKRVNRDIVWDSDFGEDHRELFDDAPLEPGTRALAVFSPTWERPAQVDGQPISAQSTVAAGPHLVQYQTPQGVWQSALLLVNGDEAVQIVLPEAYPLQLDPSKPGERRALDAMMETSDLPRSGAIFQQGPLAWMYDPEQDAWLPIRGRSPPIAQTLMIGGGGIAIAGGVTALVGRRMAVSADQARVDAGSVREWEMADEDFQRGETLLRVGLGVTATGVAAVGLGAVGMSRLSITMSPAQVQLSVKW
ncbi:MAG: hypothetical protein AAFV53_07215 [Myxococcota bacterium]